MTNHLERTVRALQTETRGVETQCGTKKNTHTLMPLVRKQVNKKLAK